MKKRVVTSIFILIVLSIIVSIYSVLSTTMHKCNMRIINSDYNENKIEVNGSLYHINKNGLYSINENNAYECLLPFNTENSKAFFSSEKSSIYLCETIDNKTKLTHHDLKGSLLGEPVYLELSAEYIYYVENDIIYCIIPIEGNDTIVTFDMQGNKIDNEMIKYEYADDVFMFLGDPNRTYYSLITDSSSKYIGRNNNLVIYMKRNYSPELKIIDLDSSNTINVDLGKKFGAYHSFSTIKSNFVCSIMTKTNGVLEIGSGHSYNGDISSLKRHKYDIYALIDISCGKVAKHYKTHRYEKIIYADTEKAITYYRGKYITYSTKNWEKIDSHKASEIKKDGSYTFETCGNYIFVFDDNTGKVINKISIE